jgi:protein gp37
MAKRLAAAGVSGYDPESPFSVVVDPTRVNEPLKRVAPARIGVCFMGDLFHRYIPDVAIGDVFDVMAQATRHTFVVPTKRPERWHNDWIHWMGEMWPGDTAFSINMEIIQSPGKNVWMGVIAENQELAKKRVHHLSKIPAEIKFLNIEPMLEPIKLTPGILDHIDWVIWGPGFGRSRKHINLDWVRRLRDECVKSQTHFFVKNINGDPPPDDLYFKQIPQERN